MGACKLLGLEGGRDLSLVHFAFSRAEPSSVLDLMEAAWGARAQAGATACGLLTTATPWWSLMEKQPHLPAWEPEKCSCPPSSHLFPPVFPFSFCLSLLFPSHSTPSLLALLICYPIERALTLVHQVKTWLWHPPAV